ncbi:hypothetical protein TNCV_1717811 [Trichonephila clavipes]|nr:hypothetical protein TNCV_1717811 [Trichonephila clavipes]
MLLYMYTDKLEDLQWEVHSSLYSASDKRIPAVQKQKQMACQYAQGQQSGVGIGEKDIVFKRRAEFLPRNVLTLRCQVWNRSSDNPRGELYFARSKVRGGKGDALYGLLRDLGLFRWDRKTSLLVQPTRKGGLHLV